jgi:putative ABC transport system ATP-binding protein
LVAPPALRLQQVSKGWRDGEKTRLVLAKLDFNLAAGESCAIVGPSGSGKSTLLNLCSAIDTPDNGQVLAAGRDLSHLSDKQRAEWRLRHCGRVFQAFHLLPTLTLAENVAVPMSLAGEEGEAIPRACEALEQLGLSHRADAFPDQTSGGEQQRAAIARALILSPALVVADEPTGNLDAETAEQISTLLLEQCRARGASLLLATHAPALAQRADRVCQLYQAQLLESDAAGL